MLQAVFLEVVADIFCCFSLSAALACAGLNPTAVASVILSVDSLSPGEEQKDSCAALWWVVFSGAACQPHPTTVQTQPTVGIHFKQASPPVPRKVNRGVLSLLIYFP